MIERETRLCIKGYLEGFIQGIIDDKASASFDPRELRPFRSESKKADLKPFHESLLPDGLLRISEFERSFSTKLGTTFEECARLIALAHHKHAERAYRVAGQISLEAVRFIEETVSAIDSGGLKRSYPELIEQTLRLAEKGERAERSSIVDLYILTHDDARIFIEIKSPKPNKGQCVEIMGRLLQIHGLTHREYPKIKAYYATAYNPYGVEKSTYKHNFALNYMDMENEVLLGRDFWELVGGNGTYEEILEIYQEVGREKGPAMFEQLVLGY